MQYAAPRERAHDSGACDDEAAREHAGEIRDDAEEIAGARDLDAAEAEVHIERVRHHAGDGVPELVQQCEREQRAPVRALREIPQRFDDGAAHPGQRRERRQRHALSGSRLGPDDDAERADADERRKPGEQQRPADEIRQRDRPRASREHADPIPRLRRRRARALLVIAQHLDAIRIDGDVLARRAEGDQHGPRCGAERRLRGIARPEAEDRRHEHELRPERPAPPLAEPRENGKPQRIERRRPHELQRVR